MAYHLESIELFVRKLPPARMKFVFGKAKPSGKQAAPSKRRPSGFLLARVRVTNEEGKTATGFSGDRPSFGWLDKRPIYSSTEKLNRLLALIEKARDVYLSQPDFQSPFQLWLSSYPRIQASGRQADHEPLSSSFASALFERAVIDAVCRLHDVSIFEAVHGDLLGVDPAQVAPELKSISLPTILPQAPQTRIHVRHTVGGVDPLDVTDWPPENHIRDGEPETLRDYVTRDGVRHFKIKISGDPKADLERLLAIWKVARDAEDPVLTLDGNESYEDIESFAQLVDSLEQADAALFDHLLFIEQPMPRRLTHDPATAPVIQRISRKKALVIDEADGELGSFPRAFEIGYSGVSHKNCKGFFKSLINYAWCHHFENTTNREAFLSGEDLSNMPIVPLQQDFAALGILGIDHCERNGHHYTRGLPFLSPREKALLQEHHPDLYTTRNGEMFLHIQQGAVDCRSLQVTGFGVPFEPDWPHLLPFEKWVPA